MSVKEFIREDEFWFAGEDKEIQFTIRDENDATIDVTGWSFEYEFVLKNTSTPAFTKTSPGGISLEDPTNGVVVVVIDAADTASLEEGNHDHILKRTDSGDVAVLAHGKAFLHAQPA